MIIICSLFITGCKSKSKNLLEPAKEGEIIVYDQSIAFGSQEDEYDFYYIKVTADKQIIWGKAVSGEEGFKVLTEDEYQSLIDIAFSKNFKNMNSDISDKSVIDGYSAYITIYYSDGTVYEVGGLNPNSEKYNKLVKKLKSFTE